MITEFLTKKNERYALTPESAAFLSRRSPQYLGTASQFLMSAQLTSFFSDVCGAVRAGGTVAVEQGMVAEENPLWLHFAHGMSPVAAPAAEFIAQLLDTGGKSTWKILDIAAGHGLFGITLRQAKSPCHSGGAGLVPCPFRCSGKRRKGRSGRPIPFASPAALSKPIGARDMT